MHIVNRTPRISIVIPVRNATGTIGHTLSSLLPQCKDQDVEVVVAVCEKDPSVAHLTAFAGPQSRIVTVPGPRNVPELRRDAVLEARGEWVVITEDHCAFPPGWVSALSKELNGISRQVRGGPVTNGRSTLLGWALYFNRYAAFLPPLREGPVDALPGSSACYPRQELMARTGLWKEGFWEFEINEALKRAHFMLWLSPALSVTQNQIRGFGEYVGLRYRQGRLYGARRLRSASVAAKLTALLRTPIVPFLLHARAVSAVLLKREYWSCFIAASPLLFIYYCAWAWGEGLGYVSGVSSHSVETD